MNSLHDSRGSLEDAPPRLLLRIFAQLARHIFGPLNPSRIDLT